MESEEQSEGQRAADAGRVVIGVSVEIPEPYGSRLQDVRDGYGDPLARAIPTHITLLGPTEVDAAVLPGIEPHLAKVARDADPFRVRLAGTGSFRPTSPVVFVQIVRGAAECERVQEQVRSGPLAVDLRFPYHPHVTVGHDLPEEMLDRAEREMADFTADFTVSEFLLYLHGSDGVWRPQWKFHLGGDGSEKQPG